MLTAFVVLLAAVCGILAPLTGGGSSTEPPETLPVVTLAPAPLPSPTVTADRPKVGDAFPFPGGMWVLTAKGWRECRDWATHPHRECGPWFAEEVRRSPRYL